MNLLDRVTAELSQIETTDFWRLYKDELAKHRKLKGDKLETCSLEEIKSCQGEILALKFVGGLPEKILKSLQNTQGE
jgi:hypothetical protein